MKQTISTLIKGFFIGSTMLVPGVSGGTMAMVLGIYEKLITSVSSFKKHKRASAVFLLLFCIGSAAGMILVADPLLKLIKAYPAPTLYFFIGAVLGGVPPIFKKAGIKHFSAGKVLSSVLFIAVGAAIVLLFAMLPKGLFSSEVTMNAGSLVLLVIAGFFAAIALVLPGISVSYILLVMGMYDDVIEAVGKVTLPYLLPLGIGLVLGIILTTGILEKAMNEHTQGTHLVILGFVLGSVIQVFPGIPGGAELAVCILLLLAGFGIIQLLYFAEKRIGTENN